jgi:hypothetical protein
MRKEHAEKVLKRECQKSNHNFASDMPKTHRETDIEVKETKGRLGKVRKK